MPFVFGLKFKISRIAIQTSFSCSHIVDFGLFVDAKVTFFLVSGTRKKCFQARQTLAASLIWQQQLHILEYLGTPLDVPVCKFCKCSHCCTLYMQCQSIWNVAISCNYCIATCCFFFWMGTYCKRRLVALSSFLFL